MRSTSGPLILLLLAVARGLRSPAPRCRRCAGSALRAGFGTPVSGTPSKKKKKSRALKPREAPEDCPCHSGLSYSACCGPAHDDFTTVATPEALLRSRYAAFSLRLPGYLADTTHPSHKDFDADRDKRVAALSKGLEASRFTALRVGKQASLGDDVHEITFEADIQPVTQRGYGARAATLYERSVFKREPRGHWLYAEGLDVNAETAKGAPA